MKTAGIIGGLGPESTVEYYRLIVTLYRGRAGDGGYPHVIINSIDMKRLIDAFSADDRAGAADYLASEVSRLARAGADFALLSANTPHIVFDEVERRSTIPMLSIVRATRDAAKASGLKRLGLFGTRFTARAGIYDEALAAEGMTLALPDDAEQEYIHERYMNELVNGVFLPETRARLVAIARRLKTDEGIEGLILGGTELPLILRDTDSADAGVPFLDTTRIHAEAVVERLLS
ncbi:MAG TPA: amino acid racemase [Pyrinomonadaceae bacterium]|nr:amino acid racemase [Pyrinomonadaceae bacterium]